EGLAGEELGEDSLRRARGELSLKSKARVWWNKARTVGEGKYVLERVLPENGELPNEHLLRLVSKKYPKQLPKVYRMLLDKRPRLDSDIVVDAISKSGLPSSEKLELFVKGARHDQLEHRYAALWGVLKLDQEQFVLLLVETLERLPRTPKGSYWLSTEEAFASLVMQTEDSRAWKAFEKAAR